MAKKDWSNHLFRGLLQSDDGVITKVLKANTQTITFETAFKLSDRLVERLKHQPEHFIFSERSRIARLGIQIKCEPPHSNHLEGNNAYLILVASPVIPGYPGLDELIDFFTFGLPVGRLVFCDPEALLTSDQVLEAIERAELKLPASTTISSDGSILIAPHKVVCRLKEALSKDTFGRILIRKDGREILNRYQVQKKVTSLMIPPGEGVVTTCSMYLNEHYVVLQSGFELGRHLPATILDPIKTRGLHIYLEIVNGSKYPIVNPLISAKIYHAPKSITAENQINFTKGAALFSYNEMQGLKKRLETIEPSTCQFLDKPVAIIQNDSKAINEAQIFLNGPNKPCKVTKAVCAAARRDFSSTSLCAHIYATSRFKKVLGKEPAILFLKYFPNIIEHRDIINLACQGRIDSLYFFEPSCENGPFLSQFDHNRLQEYHAYGLNVYWASGTKTNLQWWENVGIKEKWR